MMAGPSRLWGLTQAPEPTPDIVPGDTFLGDIAPVVRTAVLTTGEVGGWSSGRGDCTPPGAGGPPGQGRGPRMLPGRRRHRSRGTGEPGPGRRCGQAPLLLGPGAVPGGRTGGGLVPRHG